MRDLERTRQRQIGKARQQLEAIQRRAAQPKLRRRIHPAYLKTTVLSLIPGCRGLWSELAKRLKCSVTTVQRAMAQEGWEWVREAFEEEKLTAREKCAASVYDLALYAESSQVRLSASTFILERTHPDFQKSSKVTVEGGNKPVRHVMLNITPEMLKNLPVDAGLRMLEEVDRRVVEDVGSNVEDEEE